MALENSQFDIPKIEISDDQLLGRQEIYDKMGVAGSLFSGQEVEQIQASGKMQYIEVEDAGYKVNVPLAYFETAEGDIALLSSGRNTNPFKNEPILMDKDFWQFLPKWRWSLSYKKQENFLATMVNVKGESYGLSNRLSTFLGLPERTYFHPLGHPLDFRLKNLTTTYLGRTSPLGCLGIVPDHRKWKVRKSFSSFKRKYLAHCDTAVQAQQLYNAALLYHKKGKEINLYCFGRLFDEETGILNNMFPDKYFPYDDFDLVEHPYLKNHYGADGKLLPEYLEIVHSGNRGLGHKHLVAPVRDEALKAKVIARYGDENFTCFDR